MLVSDSLSVKVWETPEKCEMGVLAYGSEDATIRLESGRIISGQSSKDTSFEMQSEVVLGNNGESKTIPIDSRLKVKLKPVLVVRRSYTYHGLQFVEDVFPPSTSGFYGRLKAGEHEATYVLHEIADNEHFVLAIVDPDSARIYETHLIQPYEAEAIAMVEDNWVFQKLYTKALAKRKKTREEVLSILDAPAPSWKELIGFLGEVNVPNLKLGNTMRDTFAQIVPSSFPSAIREEFMAFFAYVVKSEIPRDDPLEYSYKFSSMAIMEELMNGHLMCLIDKIELPPYVKLMILAARGQLQPPKKAISDSLKFTPWLLYSQKCVELLPSWLDIAVNSARALNESHKIVLGLPTTANAAKKSRVSWKKRFAEIRHRLMVRGHIDSSSIGLTELVYLGAAYRWPHRHMKFIARLGSAGDSPPHLQVMLMPLPAAERLKRVLPGILRVAWSTRTSNLNLFDEKSSRWIIPVQPIVDSLDKRSSMRKLMNQYRDSATPNTYAMSKKEARVLDLMSEGIELAFLEIPEFLDNWGLSRRETHAILSRLVSHKIMDLTYEVLDSKLISLAIVLQGRREVVTALTSSLLKNTPTSNARLNETGESGVILARLPEESAYNIASQLTTRGVDYGLNIRCMRPTTFERYTSNLYQRLLKGDGTWDDDVSAFLSQARSRRRELSESNP